MAQLTEANIHQFMVKVPNSKIPELDIVLCNQNYNDKANKPT
jgi:hypothetical protein